MKKYLFRHLIFFLAVIPCISLPAQTDYSTVTKAQTQHFIDSITHSNNRTIKFWYEPDTILYSQIVTLPKFELSYFKFFHANGKVMEEGLLLGTDDYDTHIGTWKYYDERGNLFKEY